MRVYIPPMKPIHKDASFEEREAAYLVYRKELLELNPLFSERSKSMNFIIISIGFGILLGLILAFIAVRC